MVDHVQHFDKNLLFYDRSTFFWVVFPVLCCFLVAICVVFVICCKIYAMRVQFLCMNTFCGSVKIIFMQESVIEIEYVLRSEAPKLQCSLLHDDWVSCIDAAHQRFAYIPFHFVISLVFV